MRIFLAASERAGRVFHSPCGLDESVSYALVSVEYLLVVPDSSEQAFLFLSAGIIGVAVGDQRSKLLDC